jgi:dihydrofolate reductase
MVISLIVAASDNNVIGKNNQLLWRLPNDTRFFKNMTWGMPVLMGRKTYDSLKNEPLPGRFNIVITSQEDLGKGRNDLMVASSLDHALDLASQTECKETFVIGGGQIYAEAIPIADTIYMTRVHVTIEGDAYFPEIDETRWRLESNKDFPADEKNMYSYSFQTWKSITGDRQSK